MEIHPSRIAGCFRRAGFWTLEPIGTNKQRAAGTRQAFFGTKPRSVRKRFEASNLFFQRGALSQVLSARRHQAYHIAYLRSPNHIRLVFRDLLDTLRLSYRSNSTLFQRLNLSTCSSPLIIQIFLYSWHLYFLVGAARMANSDVA